MQQVFQFPPEAVEHVPSDICERLELEALFPGRAGAPLEIDLGCGEGAFLTGMAAREPGRNFLGIERLLGRVRKTSRRAARAGLCNVRLLRVESHYAVRYLLPPASVAVMHVLFPDPWPKRKHEPRRLIQLPFLEAVRDALAPGGELRLATDNAAYFAQMQAVCGAAPFFQVEPWEPGPDYPQTDFERFYRSQGLAVYRLRLRKKEPSR